MPNCHTIPKVLAEQVCTQALERDDDLVFCIIRDALTGPTYPGGGYFYYNNAKTKERWLSTAMEKGLVEVVRSLVPLSPAENVALKHTKIPSAKAHVSISNRSLWPAATDHAITNDDFVMLDILKSTQYTLQGQGGQDLSYHLLQKSFEANHHRLLRYLGQSGVDYAKSTFLHLFDDEEDESSSKVPKSSLSAICAFLGIPESEEPYEDEVVSNQMEDLTDDATFIPYSPLLSGVSCGGNPQVAANYTTLVFNARGHALCGGCLRKRFNLARRVRRPRERIGIRYARENDTDSNDDSDEDPTLDTRNLRVGCRQSQPKGDLVSLAFQATADMRRVHYREAVSFLDQHDTCLYRNQSSTHMRYELVTPRPLMKGFEGVKTQGDPLSYPDDLDDFGDSEDSDTDDSEDDDDAIDVSEVMSHFTYSY
ncbi:hypothetical protein DFS34DRAFT_655083 [Phlyctochytrium arcticum]|nr:hypothetical protein DFS34DRAFT_655083 [Phlyctochytrium arcticum]